MKVNSRFSSRTFLSQSKKKGEQINYSGVSTHARGGEGSIPVGTSIFFSRVTKKYDVV